LKPSHFSDSINMVRVACIQSTQLFAFVAIKRLKQLSLSLVELRTDSLKRAANTCTTARSCSFDVLSTPGYAVSNHTEIILQGYRLIQQGPSPCTEHFVSATYSHDLVVTMDTVFLDDALCTDTRSFAGCTKIGGRLVWMKRTPRYMCSSAGPGILHLGLARHVGNRLPWHHPWARSLAGARSSRCRGYHLQGPWPRDLLRS